MIIILLGASGTGKSTIENELVLHHNFDKIISHTTRKPRKNEQDGKDYWFIDNDSFKEKIDKNLFAEYDEYSQGRLYGTLVSDFEKGNKVVVLTPNGLRQVKKNCKNEKIFSVLIESSLGTRIKRYIDRCGVIDFDFDDKNEIASRVERDFGMFLGLEKEVDLVIQNNEGDSVSLIAEQIISSINKKEEGI